MDKSMRLVCALSPFWGTISLAILGYFIILPDISIAQAGGDPYIWSVWRGSFYLAGGATLISVFCGGVTALILDHHGDFFARTWLLRLYRLCFIMPILIVIYAIISFYGAQGWLQQGLRAIVGQDVFPGQPIYGLTGIWLVMVFANFPYAALVFLNGFSAIHPNNRRLMAQLSFSLWQRLRWVYLPVVLRQISGVSGLIFVLCFTSFSPVLILGGGPRYATLEVAIYQALRFDFDLGQTVFLSLLQVISCLSFLILMWGGRRLFPLLANAQKQDPYLWRHGSLTDQQQVYYVGYRPSRFAQFLLVITTLSLVCPLVTILFDGVRGPIGEVVQMPAFWRAIIGTSIIAVCTSLLAVIMALLILFSLRYSLEKEHREDQMLSYMTCLDRYALVLLAFPPLTLSAGLFLILRNWVPVLEVGIYIAIVVQAILSIPYILKLIIPAFQQASQQYGCLARSLNLSLRQRWSYVDAPLLKKPLGASLGISAAFAAGDLAIISLFGSQDMQTLPLLLYRLSGAYRVEAASVVAVCLIIFCLALFWGCDLSVRKVIEWGVQKGTD